MIFINLKKWYEVNDLQEATILNIFSYPKEMEDQQLVFQFKAKPMPTYFIS